MRHNQIKVEKIVAVGPVREIMTIEKAVKSSFHFKDVKVEPVYTVIPPSSSKLSREEILEKLAIHIRGSGPGTVVITDVGDTRPYKCEQMAIDVKEISNASFFLLTSKPDCVGSQLDFAKFIESRGFSPKEVMPLITYVLHYFGNPDIIPAFLSTYEDRLNYQKGNDRIILVVEDKPNYYSTFITQLYEINKEKTRILLARTFEEAEEIIHTAKERFAGAIIGLRFPKGNVQSDEAAYEVRDILHAYNKGVPIVFQSASTKRLEAAAAQDPSAFTLYKYDPALLHKLKAIIYDYFGFGDFIFRDKSGNEIARASNFEEFYSAIKTLDPDSLVMHASRDDFSNWLYLHGYKKAAAAIKPIFSTNAELLRKILIRDLAQFAKNEDSK
jgi:hypothetical protein